MKHLFDSLKTNGIAEIDRLISEKAQEGVQLDFKLKRDATTGDLHKEDRSVLGKTISAFANTGGGLLVFGIDARKGPDNVDAAQEKVPIRELRKFCSELTRAVSELVMPRHDGIEIVPICEAENSDVGYAAIWVERSERRPHRSEFAGDKLYYRRAGESSFAMEHFELEDAFNRVAPVNLQLQLSEICRVTRPRLVCSPETRPA